MNSDNEFVFKLRAWVLTTEQSFEMERLTFINREQIHIWNKLYCEERLMKTVEIFNQITLHELNDPQL